VLPYGMADAAIGVATAPLGEILAELEPLSNAVTGMGVPS
jgi:hypothetical protein